jgi:capsid protein
MAAGQYTDPVDVPAHQFVHYLDPMQIDAYRGVSKLDTAVSALRDLYEILEFSKGKAKLASALTIFTNSTGASTGSGAMDGYASTQFANQQGGMAQDIQYGQINHLTEGMDIKFPDTSSPSPETQFLITLMLKLTCMSYNLPYSFGLDATQLGGVSSRLESEQAKAEFTRGQKVLEPLAHRMKNAALIDAISKGIFPVSTTNKITRGRWSYRPHPQPDIGKESSSNINLFQSGLLNPMSYWSEDAQDPEKVADDMVRWAKIKRDRATAAGFSVEEVFGAGMAKPTSATESTSVTVPPTADEAEATETLTSFASVTSAELRAATLRELVGLLLDKLPNDQAIAAAYAIYDEKKTRTQLLNEVEARLQKEKEGKMSRFAAVGERGGIKESPKATD